MARIEFKGVTIKYGGTEAVRSADLAIPEGAYVCLVGPSGCGKTSLLRALAGFVPVAVGEILMDDKKVNDLYSGDRNLAMIFQNFALYPHLTVRQNFEFPLKAAGTPAPAIEHQLARVTEMLGMAPLLDRYPRELSGGQQQRVAIGRALMRAPGAFLLDEPLGNLDALLKLQMRTHLRQIHDELKATFIHVTHDQSEALALADTVVVMNAGSIEQAGTPAELYERPETLFVAGFIGAPPMNLIPGAIREEAMAPAFKSAGVDLDLAGHPDAAVLRRFKDKPVTLGIRPEDVVVGADSAGGIRARIVVEEFAGPEVVLDLTAGPHPLKARVKRDALPQRRLAGSEVALVLPKERLIFFDPATGKRIGG